MSRRLTFTLLAVLGICICAASARAQFAPAVGPAIGVVNAPPADPGVYFPGAGQITIPPPPAGWMAPAPPPSPVIDPAIDPTTGAGVYAPSTVPPASVPAPTGGPGAATGTGWHFFDWTADENDPDNAIVATMSPDLCDQFYKSGLSTTAGTVTAQMPATTAPAILSGSPGPMVLLLAGNRYGDPVYLGEGFEGDRKVIVIKLKKIGSPVTDPSVPNILGVPLPNGAPTAAFGGNWTTGIGQFHAPRNLTLSQSGNSVTGSYTRTGNDGNTYTGTIENGVVTGNVLKFHWTDGQDSGEGTFEMAANGQGFGGSYATLGGGSNNWDGWDHH